MKMATKGTRRIAAIALSLALLCGAVVGTGAPVSASETEIDKFSVDFQELADVVTQSGLSFTDGTYVVQENDAAIHKWVEERFDLYFNYQLFADNAVHSDRNYFEKRAHLGVLSSELTNTVGNGRWNICESGKLVLGGEGYGGGYLSAAEALTLRHDGDTVKLRNFEAEVVFNTSTYMAGGVYIAFHEDSPGRFSWQSNFTDSSVLQNDAVIVAATGDLRDSTDTAYTQWQGVVARKAGDSLANTWCAVVPEGDRFYDAEGNAYSLGQDGVNKDYKLYVKVVNGTAAIKVTSVDETVTYYDGSKAVSDGYGTISVGVVGRSRYLETIKVTELDENGNAVDLGTLAAEKEAETYSMSVDFADLAKVVTEKYAFTDGVYQSGSEDTYINEWVNANFGQYFNRECYTFAEKTYLGEESATGGDPSYFSITENGYLRSGMTAPAYGETVRTAEALYLKKDGKAVKLDDFKATVVFNFNELMTTDNKPLAFYVSFNSITPGKFGWGPNTQTSYSSTWGRYADQSPSLQDAIIIGKEHNGQKLLMVKSSGEALDVTNLEATIPHSIDAELSALTANVDYTLDMKVVGSNVTVSLKETESGTVILPETTYVDAARGDEGYVSFGVAQAGAGIKSISVQELENAESIVDTVNDFKADFADLAKIVTDNYAFTDGAYKSESDDTYINDWVDARFDAYFNAERRTFTKKTYLGEVNGSNHSVTSYLSIAQNGYLCAGMADSAGGEPLRTAEMLVLKKDGKEAVLDNFKTSVVFNFDDTIATANQPTAVYVAFNGTVPGRFGWDVNSSYKSDYTPNEADAVIISQDYNGSSTSPMTGLTVKSRNEVLNQAPGAVAFDKSFTLTQDVDYTLDVKVVGHDVTVSLKETESGTVILAETTFKGDVLGYNGYVSFGMAQAGAGFKSISVQSLDENGNVPVEEPEQADNTVVIDAENNLVKVKVGAGYQVAPGSLLVKDGDNTYIPVRVGFQNDENTQSAQYQVLNADGSVMDLTADMQGVATFVADADATAKGSMGFLGTSVNTEKGGLRFVHRMNITTDGEDTYITVGGEQKKLKDYGILVAAKAVLDNADDLDIETANASMHIAQFYYLDGADYNTALNDTTKTNKYYDISDSYVDISMMVTGITEAIDDYEFITRTYVVLEDGKVVYGDAAISSYAAAQ